MINDSDIAQLREAGTNGDNFDVSTDDIIARLRKWDELYGIRIDDVAFDRLTVHFEKLPEDTRVLADEIYGFCPDTVDQHFGCVVEMIDAAEDMGMDVPENITELIEGVDLDAPDYGVELLRKDLVNTKSVGLWWD
ncbi:MAG: DUF4253 domain-containing protein [Planctomycetota bacterium]